MQWYLNRSGRPEGPFEETQIIQMVIEGFVPWNAMVGAQGADAWIPILDHPAFADALARTSQAGMPADLEARAAAGRPPAGGSYVAASPTGGSPYSAGMPIVDSAGGLPRLSTARLVGIGLLLVALFGGVSFALSRVRGGYARVVDAIGEEMYRLAFEGESLEDDWPRAALEDGTPSIHETDRDVVRLQLVALGTEPVARFATLHLRLCGKEHSIEVDTYAIHGTVHVGGLVAHTGDACESLRRDAQGRPRASATDSSDRRIASIGERGIALWEALRDEACDLPLVTADDLVSVDIPEPLAHEFTLAETATSLQAACAAARSDSGTEAPFVEPSTIGLVLADDSGRLGVLSSRLARAPVPSGFSLAALSSRRIGQ